MFRDYYVIIYVDAADVTAKIVDDIYAIMLLLMLITLMRHA